MWGRVGEKGEIGIAVEQTFMGEYFHSLDEKGRLAVPASFREGLGASFIATRGLDRTLFLFPQTVWREAAERIQTLPLGRSDVRSFVRLLFSGAVVCEPDKQGRIALPKTLRTYAGIDRDVAVIGVSNRVEVWAAENWTTYSAQAQESYAAIAEQLGNLFV